MPDKRVLIVFSVAIVSISIALTVGLVLHYTIREPNPIVRTSTVGLCIPEGGENKTVCEQRGCIWRPTKDLSPNCTFPTQYGYQVTSQTSHNTGLTAVLKRYDNPSLYGNDVTNLAVEVTYQNEHRVRIRISDADATRYEVPREAVDIKYNASNPPTNETRLYDVQLVSQPHFAIIVRRRSTGTVVFNTSTPGFVFSDQFIQLTNSLPSDNVYGFGEHSHERFRHDMNWRKWVIFARDQPPGGDWNLYGAQTFYMNLETDGLANGVFLLNSNLMQIVLQPNPYPAITYNVLGGILDFYVFLGSTPENVVQQYTLAVGRSHMPPYWALGFQLSRYDYKNLTHVRQVVDRNRAAEIPQDVQFGDIDYMESRLDFTYDKTHYDGLPEFVQELHSRGQKYIIILDHALGSNETLLNELVSQGKLPGPYLPYTEGRDDKLFIREPRNESNFLEGAVWPGQSVFPDFTLGPTITDWWTKHCRLFWNSTQEGSWSIAYDALWIDMNEPASFVPGSPTGCSESKYNNPPFLPKPSGSWDGAKIYDKTICMDARQKWGIHYNVHSLYGHSMAIVTFNALRTIFPEKRPFVLSRSNFAGSQKYSAHWLGDNASQWPHLAWSIVGMLEYSLFGFSNTGADICGFFDHTNEELCQRWMQLGAFYPFSRNHNGQGTRDQDPAAFSQSMIRASRDILWTRYKLLPFLYTLMHEAHINGNTVVRPLLHEFTSDRTTWSIDRQFLWGPSLLISPVLEKETTFINMYLPAGRWYEYYNGELLESITGKYYNLSTPLDKIQLHVRGGYIIPWQKEANTTVFSRQNAMGLTAALGPPPNHEARGNLFWDDGESFETFQTGKYLALNFSAHGGGITIDVVHNGAPPESTNTTMDTIDVWGLGRRITSINVDGTTYPADKIEYNAATKNTRLINLGLDITATHRITWQLQS